MLRLAPVLALALLVGCVNRAKEAIAPEPQGVGTMNCREILEQCDAQCGDPLCVNRCTGEGNQAAQGQHAALLECGQQHGCTDQACMESSCPTEIATCMGPTEGTPAEGPAATPDQQAPGQTPSSGTTPPPS